MRGEGFQPDRAIERGIGGREQSDHEVSSGSGGHVWSMFVGIV